MPPKKSISTSQSQKAIAQVVAAAFERKPHPNPIVPDAGTVPPLWIPTSTPKELFPEWPNATTLATENWGNDDTPYEDSTPPLGFLAATVPVVWKRPRDFLPPIIEPTLAPLAPVAPDPKHAANAKKAAPAPPKKGEVELPKKPKAPKYAHIVHVPSTDNEHLHQHPSAASQSAHHVPLPADAKKQGGATAMASHPATPAVVAPPQPAPRRILHDFTRLWSAEQEEDLTAWRREEARIIREQEHRERVYMEFEDAIAFNINGRPRTLNEDGVQAEDLEDDGQDEDEQEGDGVDADSSPYGSFLPPSTIEIAGNGVVKPEVPHGDVVQPSFASYFRIVDQLYQQWISSSHSADTGNFPYLWEAIHPQDAAGVPIYNHAGKYSVRLYVAGKWRRIDVDDTLPVDDEGNIQLVSSSMKNELWPTILAKALIKVANWIAVEDDIHNSDVRSPTESIRLTSLVITALTSWKVTRHESTAIFAGNFHSLQEYVPQVQPSDPQNEMTFDETEEIQPGTTDQSSTETAQTNHTQKPRAVICSTVQRAPQNLAYQEASLLFDIVGDPGSVKLKMVNLDGAASIKEEELSANELTFLIVHPPMHYADILYESWPVNSNGVPEPFKNPASQFCVISSMKKSDDQSTGDTSSEMKAADTNLVNVVVTLCRIPPSCSSRTDDGNVNSDMSKHMGLDPRGSVLLIEDLELEMYRCRHSGQTYQKRQPLVFKIDTSSSTLLQLPRGDFDTKTFRVLPQTTCRYGYSLLVEGDVKVYWQNSSTYWRNVWDLQVIEGDGAYPAMLPGSWNILFKQNIEFAHAGDNASSASPELHIDLHLSDAELASAVHIYIVSQQGDHVISLTGVHGGTILPPDSTTYSLVVECHPRKLAPEGKWHMTIGSNRFFKHTTVHQPRLTTFSGVYVPNKPLVCLRDVIQHPKKTTFTSLQFELLSDDMRPVRHLTARLHVIDLVDGHTLTQHSGAGLVCVLQLPSYTKGAEDPTEENSGYIIECGIDKTKCHVPLWLQSVRPFSNKQSELPKEKAIDEDEEVQATTNEIHAQELKWRLMCWSVDEVKLEFDRTQELRFEAIRASWAEAAKDRDAHGVSSRLMFLGKHEAAFAAMNDDALSEEQIAKYKERVEWLSLASKSVEGCTEHDHIDVQSEVSPDLEVVRQPQHFVADRERDQAMMNDMDAFLQSIRDERASVKETRGSALKDQVQGFVEQRKEAEKGRHGLYAQRDEVRTQLQTSALHAGMVGRPIEREVLNKI